MIGFSFRKAASAARRVTLIGTRIFPNLRRGQDTRAALLPHRIQEIFYEPSISKLKELKKSCHGERCLIVGTAPSVKSQNLQSIDATFTFLLNRAYLIADRCPVGKIALVMTNPFAFTEYGHEALEESLDHIFLSAAIADTLQAHCLDVIRFSQWETPKMNDGFFQHDLTQPLYDGKSVAFAAIQLAEWMGFSEIVIAGIEFEFDPAEPHFYGSSDIERERATYISVKNSRAMIKSLDYCCQFLKHVEGANIVSISPNRNLDFLTYRDQTEILRE